MLCNGYDLDGVRVLLIDEHADDRELFRFVLEGCGAEVTVAKSAGDALDLVERVKPHVLSSDLTLPGEDGFSLIRKLRAAGSTVPAVAITGYARAQDREAALAAGFDMHVPKPVDPTRFVEVIATLAGRGRTHPLEAPAI